MSKTFILLDNNAEKLVYSVIFFIYLLITINKYFKNRPLNKQEFFLFFVLNEF